MIPVLKKNIRIRKQPHGAVFISSESNTYFLASPVEAFQFSLFDGTRKVEDVVNILKSMKNSPRKDTIENIISGFIENKKDFIEYIGEPLRESRIEIDPYSFLLKNEGRIDETPDRLYAPIAVDLYITRRCFLNCVYCFADAKHEDGMMQGDFNEMSLVEINNVIDEIAKLDIKRVTLTGGEPTLRSDLIDIINRFTAYGIEILLPISAYTITDDLAKKLKESGVRKVQVKLDAANPDIQDRLSRVKGCYTKIISGIQILKKYSFEISVVSVVTSWNIKDIPNVAKKCVEIGVDKFSPRIYTAGIWALKNRGGIYLNPSYDSIVWLEEELECLKKKYRDAIVISYSSSNLKKTKESDVSTCPGFISSCTILEDGSVVPCELLADFSNEFIVGNLRNSSLYEIWHSEKAKKWISRKDVSFGQPCSSCDEFHRCKGGCAWKSFVAFGEWKCDPSCIKSPKPTKISFPEVPI